MRYLIDVTETYRLENEQEVEKFLAELRANPKFEITAHNSKKKEVKSKGEVIETYIVFKVTKHFNNEKEPMDNVIVDFKYGDDMEDEE